ncbi:EAL domain-containing protein [Amphritea sp. 1_MG-2023]|uniref:putative bifunctional diguanylate cyclase/phosphodiesterase n=1 Tax=Amphritea sp. 1_MG-2023 TaxID=3062670 RepID=UPI0026E26383|nr:EAL domain-containing protein [Amphritea sp. 1_MG-2023]MDO6564795.1 EAL domain-containing protein [Amphritea sp. 1_MG-2023]
MAQQPTVSVTRRLHRLFVSSVAVVLLITGLVVMVFELYSSRHHLINRAHFFSELTSPHLASVLMIDTSPELATSLLDSYFSEPDLLGVYIYRTDGSELIHVVKDGLTQTLPQPSFKLRAQLKEAYQISTELFEYSVPVRYKGQLVGQLYLQYEMAEINRQMSLYLLFGLLIYALSLLAIYLLSKRIQRRISEPVDQILEAMKQVAVENNYALTIPQSDKTGELSELVRGFNRMLEQVRINALELRAHQESMEQHVYFDPLTGLANRRLLIQRMEQEVLRAKRSGQMGGLVYLDLDHFKTINDSLGHNVGDAVLNSVSKRIRQSVREADTPARLGGDEFVVLLPELGKSESTATHNALSIAEKVRQAISSSHQVDGRALHVTPSIGIALFNGDNHELENLLMQADLAMYRAKEEGRNQVQFFLEQMQEHADHRQQVEENLRQAIKEDKLFVCYQPLVKNDGRIVGAEALVRWVDGKNGLLNPTTFIPIAEMTDLICHLGRWVLTDVCQQMAAWEKAGKKLVVSVNISPREFQQNDFVEQVQDIVLNTGVRAEYLVFELTEGILLHNIDGVRTKMQRLSRLGIRFSLDDFGTGYSSLQYLKQLPLDTLKIDQSFVQDITTDSSDAAIVSTIIAMAQTLGINVVAEGVERREELEYLERWGCQLFQGFYFSQAVRAKRMGALIPDAGENEQREVSITSFEKHQFTD